MPNMPWLTTKNQGRAAAWLTICIALTAGFEGFSPTVYRDAVNVKTICYGQTAADGADFSKVYTKAECEQMLGTDLQKYDSMVHSCIKVPLPPHREAALVSFVYNLGQRPLCSGAVARGINSGHTAAGCRAMLQYDHAGGKVLRGLTRRREAEMKLCLMDN